MMGQRFCPIASEPFLIICIFSKEDIIFSFFWGRIERRERERKSMGRETRVFNLIHFRKKKIRNIYFVENLKVYKNFTMKRWLVFACTTKHSLIIESCLSNDTFSIEIIYAIGRNRAIIKKVRDSRSYIIKEKVLANTLARTRSCTRAWMPACCLPAFNADLRLNF